MGHVYLKILKVIFLGIFLSISSVEVWAGKGDPIDTPQEAERFCRSLAKITQDEQFGKLTDQNTEELRFLKNYLYEKIQNNEQGCSEQDSDLYNLIDYVLSIKGQ